MLILRYSMTRKSIPPDCNIEHRTYVRMTECGESLGLALEALLQVDIGGDVFGQDF
jgi:hypothetical protein